jgi:hypothetical protein
LAFRLRAFDTIVRKMNRSQIALTSAKEIP